MYSTDYKKNLVDALIADKHNIKFLKVHKTVVDTVNFISFTYGRNSRYIIEVNVLDYDTTMWHYDGEEHNLMLTSCIEDKLKELGRYLLTAHLNDIMNATKKKD